MDSIQKRYKKELTQHKDAVALLKHLIKEKKHVVLVVLVNTEGKEKGKPSIINTEKEAKNKKKNAKNKKPFHCVPVTFRATALNDL